MKFISGDWHYQIFTNCISWQHVAARWNSNDESLVEKILAGSYSNRGGKKTRKGTLPPNREVSRVLMAHSFRELGSFGFSTPDLEPVPLVLLRRIHQTLRKFPVAISRFDSIISFNFQHFFFLLVLSIFFSFFFFLVATVLTSDFSSLSRYLTLSFSLRKYQTCLC